MTANIHDVYLELERIEALLRLLIIMASKDQEAAIAAIDDVMQQVEQAQSSR